MYNTDLHLHSCLSPCADDNMTPQELVRAAKAAGLDLIALTDHNTCRNCAVMAAEAEAAGIGFIPGIEVTTQEDIHCICLFPDCGKANSFSRWLDTLLPQAPKPAPKRPMNPQQAANLKRLEERKRSYMARQISITELLDAARRFCGLCYPAHVEKPYNALYAILGSWPEDLKADAAELFGDDERPGDIPTDIKTLRVSDAHHLWDIRPGGFPLPLETPDFNGLEKYLLNR
ncbi:MAG: PHP domain-containing protein [Oscillospiraceae bacterium]|nr:PHP domain-containing protein [Oscillospiraceae bacterium]